MKIYTFATDTEDGFSCRTFATEAARDAAVIAHLLELWEEGELPEDEKPDPASPDFDIWESWEYVRRDDVDSLYMEESELEFPSDDEMAKLAESVLSRKPDNSAAPPPAETARKPLVLVTVSGGVAEVHQETPGAVLVALVDYDNSPDSHFAVHHDAGNWQAIRAAAEAGEV